MKRKVITCDICEKDITNVSEKYKFKKYENTYVNFDDWECAKWRKLDMCTECYIRFIDFVKENNRSGNNAE